MTVKSCKHPLEMQRSPTLGTPPQTMEEPSWCRVCGGLRIQLFGTWGWQIPMTNFSAPTLANLLRNMEKERGS